VPTYGPEGRRAIVAQLVADADHYTELVQKALAGARVSLWIATANVKEMRIEAPIGTRDRARGRFMSILETLEGLAARGVELRLLHAGVPSRAFRAELARRKSLSRGGLAMRQCPRVHLKLVAVDGRLLYLGSANFTGAGLGARAEGRRNFEMGLLTDDEVWLDAAQARFDAIWSGRECKGCKLRRECPRPIDSLAPATPGPAAVARSFARRAPPCAPPSSGGPRPAPPASAGGPSGSRGPPPRRS
jgi:phosphatidylserine/phosphatidylglycerophosphate/cardiolipin synthase-like enzyme